jgi:uncharacterized membrane protein YtjA (UPF0391 family)
MMRWATVFLFMAALLAPLAFTPLGRQFRAEATWLAGLALLLAAVFATRRRRTD